MSMNLVNLLSVTFLGERKDDGLSHKRSLDQIVLSGNSLN